MQAHSLRKALQLDAANEKAKGALPSAEKCAKALRDAEAAMHRRDYSSAESQFGVALEVASSSADLYLQKVGFGVSYVG